MRLSFGLEQKLVQKQVLAPRMIQSMEILQLPVLALEERIEQEMNENPMLETAESETDPDADDEVEERENPDAPADTEKELVVDETKDNEDDFERLLEMDKEFPEAFDDGPRHSANRMDEMANRKHDTLANIAARAETLQHYLEMQLGELELDDETLEMAERIITSLDSNGSLTTSLDDILPPDADEATRRLARRALEVVQSLEPTGVGARDLRECLMLQLEASMPYYEELRTLISGHMEDLRDNRLPAIQRKTGYTIEQIQAAWDQLRKLNPKPGADFTATIAPSVTPDVRLERQEDGSYVIALEEGRLPQLRISNYYRQRLASGQATPEEKEFIKRKVNAAQWLIESIQQRRNTLTKVSQAIVKRQQRFVEEGVESLEPLKMQEIADEVGVHVTTVSRAVDDKWIETPRGILPLRRFFVGGTKTEDGEDVAWDAIRLKLQEVVDNEDKANPLSDEDLASELQKHGLKVARRTITKYRRKMGIPSSRQRRDWTKISAQKKQETDAQSASSHDPDAPAQP